MDREMSTTEFVLKFVSLYITFKYWRYSIRISYWESDRSRNKISQVATGGQVRARSLHVVER